MSRTTASHEIELVLEADRFSRKGEPVRIGVPFPNGLLTDPEALSLLDDSRRLLAFQCTVLERWHDRTIRWLLLDFFAFCEPGKTYLRLVVNHQEQGPLATPSLSVQEGEVGTVVDTGPRQFLIGTTFPFDRITASSSGVGAVRCDVSLDTIDGRVPIHVDEIQVKSTGPLRLVVQVAAKGRIEDGRWLELVADLHFFAALPIVRIVLSIRNPHRAQHPGGIWELGDAGSVLLRDMSLNVELESADHSILFSPGDNQPWRRSYDQLEMYQDSSGGEFWNSPIHLNRDGQIPNSFRGYRLTADGDQEFGDRLSPVVALERDSQTSVAACLPEFWQNFPKAIEATDCSLSLRLFPKQYSDLHEIQGGEQKTHTLWLSFGDDPVTEYPLAWTRTPVFAHVRPMWCSRAQAVPYLVPEKQDPNRDYVHLVRQALEGADSFERKREAVDEFGWRHFGDIYGDHEAAFHEETVPFVSHYNNQYDALLGLTVQFLRTGEQGWWRQLNQLAWHVMDIDIYHTEEDKPAYNHGLFWHTVHYVDAGKATHRSYPGSEGSSGGGPAAEQGYATGLMMFYFLTGEEAFRDAVGELAEWILAMEDGRQTIFRWLSPSATGLASASGSADYNGPGRAPANAVLVLLDQFRLSGERRFLDSAESLIRRVVHPDDDIRLLDLLDRELRWYYTMFLQALGIYLDRKYEIEELDQSFDYARASLLHYSRWMAEFETPYLSKPELLEFPTETWAAQDMRKSEVFKYAAKYASKDDRARFLERARFFFQYSVETLTTSPKRTYCRPMVLLLNNGPMEGYSSTQGVQLSLPRVKDDFGSPELFFPQKVKAIQRFKRLLMASSLLVLAAIIVVVLLLV